MRLIKHSSAAAEKETAEVLRGMHKYAEDLKAETENNAECCRNLENERIRLENDLNGRIKEKSEDLYGDIKDLSYIIHDTFETLNARMSAIEEKIGREK